MALVQPQAHQEASKPFLVRLIRQHAKHVVRAVFMCPRKHVGLGAGEMR